MHVAARRGDVARRHGSRGAGADPRSGGGATTDSGGGEATGERRHAELKGRRRRRICRLAFQAATQLRPPHRCCGAWLLRCTTLGEIAKAMRSAKRPVNWIRRGVKLTPKDW